jgi:hypothetical protein
LLGLYGAINHGDTQNTLKKGPMFDQSERRRRIFRFDFINIDNLCLISPCLLDQTGVKYSGKFNVPPQPQLNPAYITKLWRWQQIQRMATILQFFH